MFSKEAIALTKASVAAITTLAKQQGKTWRWKPEVGEFYLDFSMSLGSPYLNLVEFNSPVIYWAEHQHDEGEQGDLSKEALQGLIPILHWERLIEILVELGYEVTVTYESAEELDERAYCSIWREGKWRVENKRDEDCQVAVMLAVIDLVKESNHVKS